MERVDFEVIYSPSAIQKLLPVFQKSPDLRSDRELSLLVALIKRIQFFKERKIKEADFVEIANCLLYEKQFSENIVFDHGKSNR